MPTIDNGPDGKEEEENEVDENEKDSVEQSSSSDEDEGSLDEWDTEIRRAECADDIGHLEKHFNELKEMLYRERIQLLDRQLEEVQSETSVLYTQQLKDLEINKHERLETAETLRDFKKQCLENRCDCELQASRQHLENERQTLFEMMRSEAEEKLQEAEEYCHQYELSKDAYDEQRPQKRQRRGDGMPEKRRKTTVTGPVIIYMLPESDIFDDWMTIRRAAMKMEQQASSARSSHSSSKASLAAVHSNGPTTTNHVGSKLPSAAAAAAASTMAGSSVLVNGHYEDGKLYFQDAWYLRGSKIVVRDLTQDSTVPATITSISSTDMSLAYADGGKSKLSISQLQRGKMAISFQE